MVSSPTFSIFFVCGSSPCLSSGGSGFPGRRVPAGTRVILAQASPYEFPEPTSLLEQLKTQYLGDMTVLITALTAVAALAFFLRKVSSQ